MYNGSVATRTWWNRQTRKPKELVIAISYGFKSHRPHQQKENAPNRGRFLFARADGAALNPHRRSCFEVCAKLWCGGEECCFCVAKRRCLAAEAFFKRAGQSPAKWFKCPIVRTNNKRAPRMGCPFVVLRPLCGLEPLPPDRTSKFAVGVVAAEKNAELASRQVAAFSRQGILQASAAKPQTAGQVLVSSTNTELHFIDKILFACYNVIIIILHHSLSIFCKVGDFKYDG